MSYYFYLINNIFKVHVRNDCNIMLPCVGTALMSTPGRLMRDPVPCSQTRKGCPAPHCYWTSIKNTSYRTNLQNYALNDLNEY